MGRIHDLLVRNGYVKLSDYGLVLTAEGRILSTRPAVLDDGLGGRIVGWRDGDLAAMELERWPAQSPKPVQPVPAPLPRPIRRAATPTPKPIVTELAAAVSIAPVAVVPPPTPVAPSQDADGDWDWEIAIARARAAADEVVAAIPPAAARAASEHDWDWQIAIARARAVADDLDLEPAPAPRATPPARSVQIAAAALPARTTPAVKPDESPSPRTVIPVPSLPRATVGLRPLEPVISSAPRRFPRATDQHAAMPSDEDRTRPRIPITPVRRRA